ncbi:hypothetical protein HWV62_16224 [Athelia sp. TMB]|nr:hypothetical protein HWV62_16224 [Athelia sp. TMB]
MSDSDTPASSTSRTLAGEKRQRSRQVCTECRQKKIKCDAQDTFPAPCTRCANTQPAPLCRVDPNFKRSRKRPVKVNQSEPASRSSHLQTTIVNDPIFASASNAARKLVPLVSAEPLLPGPHLDEAQLAEAVFPSVFELGAVRVTLEQANVLFNEFFAYFHPYCPLLIRPRSPINTHRAEPLLFWTILTIASRRPAVSAEAKHVLYGADGEGLRSVTYRQLAEEVKASVAALGIIPPRHVDAVQALLLLCEWPLPSIRTRDDRSWHYSSLAIQIALQLGLHRPHFSHEFSARVEEQPAADSIEGQERTLAWVYCHIIGHSVASCHGIPSLLKDDHVTLSVSALPLSPSPVTPTPGWLSHLTPLSILALRIARLTDRIAATLGHSTTAPSGQLAAESTTPLYTAFSAELGELERNATLGGAGMEAGGLTAPRLHLCRIRLCAFMLQTPAREGEGGGVQRVGAATDCYVSCMRLAEAACTVPQDEVARWPLSVSFGYPVACICLIRLLSLPEGAALDMGAALTQVSSVFRVASALNVREDSLRGRINELVSFSVRNAHLRHGEPEVAKGDKVPDVQSRMGLANWMNDAVARARQARAFHEMEHPGRGAEIISCAKDLLPPELSAMEASTPALLLSEPPMMDYAMFVRSVLF